MPTYFLTLAELHLKMWELSTLLLIAYDAPINIAMLQRELMETQLESILKIEEAYNGGPLAPVVLFKLSLYTTPLYAR